MNKQKLTTFYIVRHGETDWNEKGIVQGGLSDIPLNATGEKQAKSAGERLHHVKFDAVFSSHLLRAKKTAEIISLEHKLAIQTTELLRERAYGQFEGKPSHTHWELQKELIKKLSKEALFKHKFSDDYESDEEIAQRIIPFFRETALSHPGKNVLVTTHAGVLRALLTHLAFVNYKTLQRGAILNTAHVVLESDGVEFFVKETYGITITQ